jgi:hypothetical protein
MLDVGGSSSQHYSYQNYSLKTKVLWKVRDILQLVTFVTERKGIVTTYTRVTWKNVNKQGKHTSWVSYLI